MTHKKKKTLSDNISFLLSNTSGKLVNPDEDINTESQARVVDEEDLDGDLGDTVVAPSKLRQKNVALLDAIDRKYSGGVTSRKSLRNSDSESDQEQDEENSENSDEGDDDDDFEGNSLADSEDNAIADLKKKGSESFASFTDFNGDDGSDYEGAVHDDDDESDEREDKDAVYEDEDGSVDGGESALGDNIQHFSMKDTNAEVLKGQAVRNQLGVWDSLMECRIQLQKLSVYSNQLPQANAMSIFRTQGGSSFNSNVGKVEGSLTKLLDSLLNLQESLLKQYPETKDLSKTVARLKEVPVDDGMDDEISSSDDEKNDGSIKDEENGSDQDDDEGLTDEIEEEENENIDERSIMSDEEGNKLKRKNSLVVKKPAKRRKLSEYSHLLAKHHKDFSPYRNSTIQKWNTKTQVAVGRAGSKNFSAFEQSTLQQIEHILADKPRLIRRTQLKRSDVKVLGQVKMEEEKSTELTKEGQSIPDVPVVEDKKMAESNKEYDPEIFDDTDFYHQLLRELIEKKTADVTDPVQLGRQWIELQKMRSKMKRKVDVKASKGRRLRYAVHPKLVNFMAPQPELAWSEEAKNELFASLFGQRKM